MLADQRRGLGIGDARAQTDLAALDPMRFHQMPDEHRLIPSDGCALAQNDAFLSDLNFGSGVSNGRIQYNTSPANDY